MEGPLKGTCWNIGLESLGWGLRPPHLPWKIPELLELRWVGEGGLCPRWAPSQSWRVECLCCPSALRPRGLVGR